jgi:hypothetical protein
LIKELKLKAKMGDEEGGKAEITDTITLRVRESTGDEMFFKVSLWLNIECSVYILVVAWNLGWSGCVTTRFILVIVVK